MAVTLSHVNSNLSNSLDTVQLTPRLCAIIVVSMSSRLMLVAVDDRLVAFRRPSYIIR